MHWLFPIKLTFSPTMIIQNVPNEYFFTYYTCKVQIIGRVFVKSILETVVIGGGQAGLASGYHLQNEGLQYLILESSNEVGGSWPSYYDSLKLFSPAGYSSMPGMKFPGNKIGIQREMKWFVIYRNTGGSFIWRFRPTNA